MCQIDSADYHCRVMRTTTPRARKHYACYECRAPIRVGDVYQLNEACSDDYGWERVRTCLACVPAQDWLIRECGGFLWGGVSEDLQEHLTENFYPREKTRELAKLLHGMARRSRLARQALTVGQASA